MLRTRFTSHLARVQGPLNEALPLISLLLLATAAFGQTYTASTFAGVWLPENLPGASVSLNQIGGVAVDAAGNVFLSLPRYAVVMRLDVTTGILTRRDAFRQPGMFDWDLRLLKAFRLGDRARLEFSVEVFYVTRSTNKTFNGDGETRNPFTALNFANNTALIPTFAPGTDRFGCPRQGQLGVRLIF